jgi:hypothetical protein
LCLRKSEIDVGKIEQRPVRHTGGRPIHAHDMHTPLSVHRRHHDALPRRRGPTVPGPDAGQSEPPRPLRSPDQANQADPPEHLAARLRLRLQALVGVLLLIPLLLVLVLALFACTVKDKHTVSVTPQLVPSELFVAPDGLDSNPGTRTAPLRSLARAAQLVAPGVIVNVLPGTYAGGLRTTVDGLPDARIVFRSTRRWGARIVPPAALRTNSSANSSADPNGRMAWDNRASYIDIEGFEVDGSAPPGEAGEIATPWRIGIYSGGSHDRILGNHVHDIATKAPCDSGGGSGIGVDSYYRGKDSEVNGNSVHDIGPPGCRYVQGIYFATTGSIRNNIVYRVAEAGIHLWHDAREVVIANNTVAASNTGILVGGGDFYHTQGPDDHTRVFNNIVFDNRYGISEQGATGPHNSYRNNLVFKNSERDWQLAKGMLHSGTVAQAPHFVDYRSEYRRDGTPDFRLAAHSPAIGRGLDPDTRSGADAGGDGPDFNDKTRARAAAVDIGACQH